MTICLLGYMGCGKSTVAKYLSTKLQIQNIDLDDLIQKQEQMQVSEIFKKKGEIYFRKTENQVLQDILDNKLPNQDLILATGGGTPVFYNNLEIINSNSISFYLQNSPQGLAERLITEKSNRPLIAHLNQENLTEFIAKHLFERNLFYQKAHYTISTQNKTIAEIGNQIIEHIKTHQNLS